MDKVTFPTDSGPELVIVKARGRTFEKDVAKRIPIVTDEALIEKFMSTTSKILSVTKAKKAIEAVMKLENISDVRELMKLFSS